MSRVLIIDIPRGSLDGLKKKLERAGVKVERQTKHPPDTCQVGQSKVLGVVVHHKRADTIPGLGKEPGLAGVPVLIWYPDRASEADLDSWHRTGALDFLVGPIGAREFMARIKGLERSLRTRLPWLQKAVGGLIKISRAATSRDDDFTVLKTTVREVERLFPGIHCAIMMLSSKRGTAMVITQGSRPDILDIPLDLTKYPEIQKMLATRRPVAIKNVQKHPMMREVRELIKAKDIHSILATPIFYREEVVGLIMLRSAGSPRAFDRIEISFCEMVAQNTAVSLRNIKLSREVIEEVRRTKEAKRAARKKTSDLARMEAMFDHASDGIVVVDSKGRIKGVNVNFTRLSGYAKEDVEGKSIEELIFPRPGESVSVMPAIKGKKEGSKISTQILRCKDASKRHVVVRLDNLPKRRERLISMHDVTEERELEDALRRTKEFLENVIQSSMDAIIAADMNGTIILFNASAESVSGYKASDVVGNMNIVDFYAPGVARDIMRRIRSDDYGGRGKLEACLNQLINSEGEEIPINMSAAIMYEENREVASVGIFQDLRERIMIEKDLRVAQEQLMQSRQKEAIAAVSGAAAHELNQPLTSILGYAELLKRVERNLAQELPDHSAMSSLKNAAEVIYQESERMAEVVKKIGQVREFETKDYVGGTKIIDLDRARKADPDDSRILLQTLLENMNEAVVVIGEDTVIKLANPAAEEITGENPLGKSFARYLKGIEYKKSKEAFELTVKGEKTERDIEFSAPDGSTRTVSAIGVPLPEGKGIMGIYTDVTEFRRTQQTTKESSAFQAQLLKSSTLPMITLDVDGKISFWNKASEKLFGYSAEEVQGKLPDSIIHKFDQENFHEHIRRLRREGDLADELKLVKKSGEVFQVYHVDAVVRDDEGRALGFLLVIFDLSERAAVELELKEKTEQIAVMSDIAHEIRTGVGMEEVLGGVLKNLARVIPMDLCAVTLNDEEAEDVMIVGYHASEDRPYKSTLRLYEDADTMRKLLLMDQPAIYNDASMFQEDFLFGGIGRDTEKQKALRFKSLINYPLIFRGEVMGTLHVTSAKKDQYSADDIDRLSQFAGPITMALANARLFNQIQQNNLELSRRTAWMENLIRASQGISMEMDSEEIIKRLVEPYFEAHSWQHLTAWLEDPEEGGLLLAGAYNYSGIEPGRKLDLDPETRDLLQDKHEILDLGLVRKDSSFKPILDDAKAALLVPMVALDQKMGLLIFESHHLKPFTEGDKMDAGVLAAQIAGALRNLDFCRDLDLATRFQRGLIEDANALILVLVREGRIELINRALEELLDMPKESVVGMSFWDFFDTHTRVLTEDGEQAATQSDFFKKIVRKVEQGENLVNLKVTIISPRGRESQAVFNTSSILDRNGSFQGFIAIGQNMTRYREMEKNLLQAEKMATVGQMAAGVAHELNNPLTGILHAATMLGRNKNLDEKSKDLVEKLTLESLRIESLAHNLMSYSRPSQEQMVPLDIRAVVMDSLSFSHYELSRGRVKVKTKIPKGIKPVRGIKDQLQQVFINLLVNAGYACAEKGGGNVTIDVSSAGNGMVEVAVSDDGAGIDEELFEKLFDPFFTTKPEGKGTGLGLTIVKEIVARHDGKIQVKSEPDKGSTFIVTLPVYSTD